MSVIRAAGDWIVCVFLGLIVLGPIAALCAAAVLERGPNGEVRASIFGVAVAALDPFVWTCARNSISTAGATAIGAGLLGVFVGRLVGDWRFPARPLLVAAMKVSAVAPPAILAMGLASLFGAGASPPPDWPSRLGPLARYVPVDWRWYAWFWAALVQGGAIAALACVSAQSRIDPAWRDAAGLAGGARSRVWRKLNWPLLRPSIARASGLVFALTIADPGAPMVLGLRRTVGYQIIVNAMRDEPYPLMVLLGLIALAACLVVRVVLNGWGGPEPVLPPSVSTVSRPLRPASWRRRAAAVAFAVVWGVAAAGPLLVVAAAAARGGLHDPFQPGALIERLSVPSFSAIAAHSVWLGLWVCVLFFLAGRLVRRASSFGPSRTLAGLMHFGAPTLVMGVAALCLAQLADLAAGALDASSREGGAWLIRAAVSATDQLPYLIPAIGVWLAMTPTVLASWVGGEGPGHDLRDHRIAAAVLAGARWARARRLATDWGWTEATRRFVLTACLAGTNIAPALILTHREEVRTIGPGIVLLREDPEFGLGPASTLAVAALAINTAAVLSCSPSTRPVSRSRSAIVSDGAASGR